MESEPNSLSFYADNRLRCIRGVVIKENLEHQKPTSRSLPDLDGDGSPISTQALARFWIAAYSRLVEMETRALEEAPEHASPVVRRDLEMDDLQLLTALRDDHRERLRSWSERLEAEA